ncbi:MAG TPA: hypothetical protein VF695_09105, partial [Sphingomonas sp.]
RPPGGAFVVWDHYPPNDCVDHLSGCRWFYHAHPEGERDGGEHGHFHLFFDRARFRGKADTPLAGPPSGRSSGADVVHIIAIAIDLNGLPMRLFTVNRWVTDEWLYPAAAISRRLPRFDLSRAGGDALVNAWLTAAIAFFRPQIRDVLRQRDARIATWTDMPASFENREQEVLSMTPICINDAVAVGSG